HIRIINKNQYTMKLPFICLLLCLLSINIFCQNQDVIPERTLYGQVTNGRNTKPIEGVKIDFLVDKNPFATGITTNQNGSFKLERFKPSGLITLILRKNGFRPEIVLHDPEITNMDPIKMSPDTFHIGGKISSEEMTSKSISQDIGLSYTFGPTKNKSIVIKSDGFYEFKEKLERGKKITFRFKFPGIPLEEKLELIIPEYGDFPEIYLHEYQKKKVAPWLLGIGAVLFTAGSVYANEKSRTAYAQYVLSKEGPQRDDLFAESNRWNRLAIVSGGAAIASSITFGIVIGKKSGKKIVPKVFVR
ncbi:MAG: carboxypeptidase-like regulatory domain-containing protein, partial [Bacteroidota bacterium]